MELAHLDTYGCSLGCTGLQGVRMLKGRGGRYAADVVVDDGELGDGELVDKPRHGCEGTGHDEMGTQGAPLDP